MTRRDRRGRHRHTPVDRRRRPEDGFRASSAARFDRLVSSAFDRLPRDLVEHMDNVQITVVDVPSEDPAGHGEEILLGLYEGVPRTERALGEAMLPDRITLFRRPLELRAASGRDLAELVRDTVIHEIAHHFGIDDDRLDDLGWA